MRKIIPSMVFTEDNKERCASVEQIVQCRKSSQNRIVICACALSTTSLCACADGSCRHPGSCTHSVWTKGQNVEIFFFSYLSGLFVDVVMTFWWIHFCKDWIIYTDWSFIVRYITCIKRKDSLNFHIISYQFHVLWKSNLWEFKFHLEV